METFAMVILAYGLTTHLRDHVGPVTVTFGDARPVDTAAAAQSGATHT